MNSKRTWVVASAVLFMAILASGYFLYLQTLPATLKLNFQAGVGKESLEFNQIRYPNPGGEGKFKIRDFQFYISNIRLLGDSSEYIEPDSYHLARFDIDATGYKIELEDVPRQQYDRIEFAIGVDSVANSSIASVGDLDPNSRMAWNWEVGYKFVLFEGGLVLGEVQYPLVYHVGFNENLKSFSMALDRPPFDGPPWNDPRELTFDVDILQLFSGKNAIDMAALPSVKFDKADAGLIADNYATMVTLRRD